MLSIDRLWELSKAWYDDCMLPSYRRRTAAAAGAIFARLGLTSEFWQITGDPAEPQK